MIRRLGALCALALGLTACPGPAPAPTPGGTPTPAPVSLVCVAEKTVSGAGALAIASELQCSNQAAIQASIDAAAAKAGICTSNAVAAIGKPKPAKPPLKSVGSDICKTVADNLVASLVNGVIPPEWGCTATNATTSAQTLVDNACVKVFP